MRIQQVPASRLDSPSRTAARGGARRGRPPGSPRDRVESLVRTFLDAFTRNDDEGARSLLAKDAVIHPAEDGADVIRAFRALLASGAGSRGGSADARIFDVEDVLASPTHAVVLFTVAGESPDGAAERRHVVCRVAGGRIAEVWLHEARP